MGMFDSFFDTENREWQTKALDCNLAEYSIGDALGEGGDWQVQVIGPCYPHERDGDPWAWATIRDGRLAEVGVERDPSLFALGFSGGPYVGENAR